MTLLEKYNTYLNPKLVKIYSDNTGRYTPSLQELYRHTDVIPVIHPLFIYSTDLLYEIELFYTRLYLIHDRGIFRNWVIENNEKPTKNIITNLFLEYNKYFDLNWEIQKFVRVGGFILKKIIIYLPNENISLVTDVTVNYYSDLKNITGYSKWSILEN